MTNFESLLQLLAEQNVELILIGGVAATIHGSTRLTNDLDIVYRRTPDNMARLVASLVSHHPYLRGAPPNLPFHFNVETFPRGLNFTLPFSIKLEVFGISCYCLGLQRLIEVKRATGRPRDLEVIAELEALQEEREKQNE